MSAAATGRFEDKKLPWCGVGEYFEEHLYTFMRVSPFMLAFASLIFLSGYYSELILVYLCSHTTMFFLFYKQRGEKKIQRNRMGVISDAQEELDRAKRDNETPKTVYYFSNYGAIVKNFQGSTQLQKLQMNLRPENVLYDYLVKKDVYMTHTLIAGSTGAGKTVAITSAYIEPLVKSGGGFIYCECKGDMPITHSVMSMAAEYGREDEVYVLDFSGGVSKYTHSLAPLVNGDADKLTEVLTNLIKIMEGDNAWVTDKALEFMGALLFPLVIMRDLKIFVDSADIPKIMEQLKSEGNSKWREIFAQYDRVEFTFEALKSYASFQSAINLLYLFRELLRQKNFEEEMRNHHNYRNATNLYKTYLESLKLFLDNHGVDTSDELNVPDYFKVVNADQQRENNKAITPWTKAFFLFGNEAIFGSVVNKRYPDINFLDAMKTGKMVIVSLPSLANSRDKNNNIGKLITSLIKAALGEMLNKIGAEGNMKEQEIQKRWRPYKLPYMLLFDEIGNIGNEMMAAMASMIRSIGVEGGGIGMLVAGQSHTDLKRMGDNDGEQLMDNLTIKYYLSLSGARDDSYAKIASDQCGEHWVPKINEQLIIKQNPDSDLTDGIAWEKELWYPKDYFLKQLTKKTGEGIIIEDGFEQPEKIICRYVEANPAVELKLVRNISHEELMRSFNNVEYVSVIEDGNVA